MTQCLSLAATDPFSSTEARNPLEGLLEGGFTGAADRPDAKTFPLTMAAEGERVRIQGLRGGKGMVMRLTELGLNQGAEVRVIQRQGGGLIVARGETRIALGGGMAMKILVTRV
ncbi:FeoA family protein [Thiocystis violacea]|uniref:FeoA family protein n=1 Tax=Thiocystis violacea TaxID=13725 RepID=UPI001903F49F|nr:FeoA family protein [Thiocystis violacea]MBK1722585.1 hypothetical protein [Thiocystis violacea]